MNVGRNLGISILVLFGSALLGALCLASAAHGAADNCPNAEIRAQQGSTYLSGCRAFELVSPADDTGGAPAGVATDSYPLAGLAPSIGDERFVYGAAAPIGEYESGATNPYIFGKRTPHGWTAVTATRTTDGGETPLHFSRGEPTRHWSNEEGTAVAFGIGNTLGPPLPAVGGVFNTIYRIPEVGLPEWLSAPGPGGTTTAGTESSDSLEVYVDPVASRDLQTVAFAARSPLTPNGPPQGTYGVYAYKDGQLELASILPNGDLPPASAYFANPFTGYAGTSSPPASVMRNVLTPDGRFVIFKVNVAGATALYVRDLELNVTHELAPPSGPAEGLANVSWFPGATATLHLATFPNGFVTVASDAPVGFFRSRANLAPGATGTDPNKVYEADLATGELTFREEIDGAPVEVSADGSKVMFLRPTGPTASPWELRFWDAAEPEQSVQLGTISGAYNSAGMVRSLRSTPDGDTWFFNAAGSLDPDHPAVSVNLQLYRWQIGDAHPTCLSCQPVDGVTRFTGVNLSPADYYSTETVRSPNGTTTGARKYTAAQRPRTISDDGSVIGFDTPDRLVPADRNEVRDAYLWDADAPPGERLQLLSGGTGTAPAFYLDISPDGTNAFFTTREGLISEDIDNTYDVYVARREGGFRPPAGESCLGEDCRPAGTNTEPVPPIGSIDVTGNGNVKPGDRDFSLRVQRLRAASGSAARVMVAVPDAGTITISGGKVRRNSISASEAGSYPVRIGLKPKAKRALRKRGKLTVGVRISYRADDGRSISKRAKVKFRKTHSKQAQGGKGGR